jgi:uncharacterized membrane protein YhhN
MSKTRNRPIVILFMLSMMLYLILLPVIHFPLKSILKVLPIVLLIILTWKSQTSRETKAWLLAALGFSLLGDVMLTFPAESALQGGILSFILAHCAFITLYYKDAKFQARRVVYFLGMLLFVALSYLYLFPYLDKMLIPVTVYLSFLTLMVFSAFLVRQQAFLIITGACFFLLSDFLLALNLFVFNNKHLMELAIMLTYYLAQFLIVSGISKRRTGIFNPHSNYARVKSNIRIN